MGPRRRQLKHCSRVNWVSKLMASGVVDFKSRAGLCPVNTVQRQKGWREGRNRERHKLFLHDGFVRISDPEE